MAKPEKIALLTVGSTQFAPFVKAALSTEALGALAEKGYTRFIVQYGQQERPRVGQMIADGERRVELELELHAFMDDIEGRMKEADLVLSHAGAGSILAALRGPALSPLTSPKQLIIVPNDTLMDAHQSELADEMEKHGWAHVARPDTLAQVIRSLPDSTSWQGYSSERSNSSQRAFPTFEPTRIQSILDEQMGYL